MLFPIVGVVGAAVPRASVIVDATRVAVGPRVAGLGPTPDPPIGVPEGSIMYESHRAPEASGCDSFAIHEDGILGNAAELGFGRDEQRVMREKPGLSIQDDDLFVGKRGGLESHKA